MSIAPRVALFPSAFHPHVGGVEELTRQLGLELLRRGSPPLIVTNRYPTDLPRADDVEGLAVRRERFSVPERRLRPLVGFAAHTARSRKRIAGALDEYQPEVLHVQCVSSNGWYALAEKRRTGIPLVVSLQGELTMDANRVYQRSRMLRGLWRRVIDAADVVTACSGFVLREAEDHYEESLGERGHVVPNGVAMAETGSIVPYDHPRPYVLGIGRMVHQKGFDLLLEAFQRIAHGHADVDLLLAGDGDERFALESLAQRLALQDRVFFLGSRQHAVALSLFRGAQIFVLPSRHEPQGIVVLEAMAVETPVVAAAVGGVPEVVKHGINGWLFGGSEVGELAARLDTLLSSRGPYQDLVAAGLATARSHDWPTITDRYCDVYRLAGVAFQ